MVNSDCVKTRLNKSNVNEILHCIARIFFVLVMIYITEVYLSTILLIYFLDVKCVYVANKRRYIQTAVREKSDFLLLRISNLQN